MWPFLGAVAAPLIGGLFGKQGVDQQNAANAAQVERTNQFNAAEAEKNRQFQENMSNTQWQRGVADMRAAGLNPALAYQQGGASAPSGSSASGQTAHMENTREGVSQALSAAVSNAMDMATKKAQIDNIEMDTAKKNVEAQVAGNLGPEQLNQLRANNEILKQNWQFNQSSMQQRIAAVQIANQLNTSNAGEVNARTHLLLKQAPKAQNEAAAESTWWKKHVAPFLNDAASTAHMMSTPAAAAILP